MQFKFKKMCLTYRRMFPGLVESVEVLRVGESTLSSIIYYLRRSSSSCVLEISLQTVIRRKVLVVMTVINMS